MIVPTAASEMAGTNSAKSKPISRASLEIRKKNTSGEHIGDGSLCLSNVSWRNLEKMGACRNVNNTVSPLHCGELKDRIHSQAAHYFE